MACVVFVALLAAVSVADGQAVQDGADEVDCSDGGRTQYEMNVCTAREAKLREEQFEALISELNDTLDDDERAEFAEVQELWLEYRETDCRWATSFFEGGSIQPTLYAACIRARTDQRIEGLKILLCEGRGMTGPCEASNKY